MKVLDIVFDMNHRGMSLQNAYDRPPCLINIDNAIQESLTRASRHTDALIYATLLGPFGLLSQNSRTTVEVDKCLKLVGGYQT